MKATLFTLLIAGFALLAAAPAAAQTPVNVDLAAQNASGISGTATLTQMGDDVRVVIDLTGMAASSIHPAHIHSGACPAPGTVVHPLTNVVNGKSTTTLTSVTLASIADGAHAINLHESPDNLPAYISCGNIAAMAMAMADEPTKTAASATSAMTTTTAMTKPATLPKTGGTANAWWLALALVALVSGLAIQRRTAAQAR